MLSGSLASLFWVLFYVLLIIGGVPECVDAMLTSVLRPKRRVGVRLAGKNRPGVGAAEGGGLRRPVQRSEERPK